MALQLGAHRSHGVELGAPVVVQSGSAGEAGLPRLTLPSSS